MDRWINPHFSRWLTTLPTDAASELGSGIDYLSEHGRGAVLPDVRHRIQISRHFPNMSEVRAKHGNLVLRALTCLVHDGPNPADLRRRRQGDMGTTENQRLVRRLRSRG